VGAALETRSAIVTDSPQNPLDWNAIENFIGYGNPKASVVFVGLEEGLDSEAHLDAELRLRSTFPPIVGFDQAFANAPWQQKLIDPTHTVSQRTWRPMCDLMLRRDGVAAPTLAERNNYQGTRLGRSDGETLLAELLPYPNVRISSWPYATYDRFETREECEDALIDPRIALLQAALATPDHQLIVCYGKAQWANYKRVFPTVVWHSQGHYAVGARNKTRIVLTPHFSSRAFNTEQQLDEFAAVALGQL
jgi:uracil-DNA glycosylase